MSHLLLCGIIWKRLLGSQSQPIAHCNRRCSRENVSRKSFAPIRLRSTIAYQILSIDGCRKHGMHKNILNAASTKLHTGLKIDCTRQLLLPSHQVPQSAVPDPKTKWPVRRMERSWPTHGSHKRTLSRKVPAPKSHRNLSHSWLEFLLKYSWIQCALWQQKLYAYSFIYT